MQTETGLAGELQRLILRRRKRPLAKFVYKHAGVILQSLRLVEE